LVGEKQRPIDLGRTASDRAGQRLTCCLQVRESVGGMTPGRVKRLERHKVYG
jgi:hypothetical protein